LRWLSRRILPWLSTVEAGTAAAVRTAVAEVFTVEVAAASAAAVEVAGYVAVAAPERCPAAAGS
jgi:hypothetical protein